MKICPRCGRSEGEAPFIGGLCKDCYVEVHGVAKIPGQIQFLFCQYCGRYKYQGGWNEPSGTVEETIRDYVEMVIARKGRPTQDIEEFWVEDIRLERPYTGPGIYRVLVTIAGRSGDVIVSERRLVNVKVDVGVCPMCTNRITKRGYNAIIQVRSSDGRLSKGLRRRIDKFLEEQLSTVLRSSIIGIEERREGFDILVNEPSTARMIAAKLRSEFMGKTVETWKLVGRKSDGSRKGRLTILVRLPDIGFGDIIDIGGEKYLYLARSPRGAPLMLNLSTGREVTMRPDVLWRSGFRKEDGRPEARRLMLLSVDRAAILFMDVDRGYETIEFPRSRVRIMVEGFEPGKTYRVIVIGGRAYVLGEDQASSV